MHGPINLGHPCAQQRQGHDHPLYRVMPKVNALPPVELVRELFTYDKATGVLTWQKSINNRVKVGSRVGRVSPYGYLQTSINRTHYYVHRIIWLFVKGEDPGQFQVDHIDGNRLNNRIDNLRLATAKQNGANRGKQINNTSGYKGVCWNARYKKWQAGIQITLAENKKYLHIGYFDTPELAHMAYCKAAAELHGEFARAA